MSRILSDLIEVFERHGRPSNEDRSEAAMYHFAVLQLEAMEKIMANLQDLAQKTSDQTAALTALSAAVDVMKSAPHGLSPADQSVVDGVATALDQNSATIAAIQIKVNNP